MVNINNDNIKKLCGIFFENFNQVYKECSREEKRYISEYKNFFFKKWYYSTLVENSDLTPAYLVRQAEKGRNMVYPVLGKTGNNRLQAELYEYSIKDHPSARDFRIIAKKAENGIRMDETFTIKDEFFADLKGKLTLYDKSYVGYLIQLGIEMNVYEEMPSVGVIAFKLGSDAKKYMSMDNETLFKNIVDAAIKVASHFLTGYIINVYCEIKPEDVAMWLTEPISLDNIYDNYFCGNTEEEYMVEKLLENGMSDERQPTLVSYVFGTNIDRWFLTPFGYYFRLIDPFYLCRFSCYDEIKFFLSAWREGKKHNFERFSEAAVYSPCSYYRLTEIGMDMFGSESIVSEKENRIFEELDADSIIDILCIGDRGGYEKISELSAPVFDICTLRIENTDIPEIWAEIEIPAMSNLNFIHLCIYFMFGSRSDEEYDFRFYKLPESPFTEYRPVSDDKNTKGTGTTLIGDILDEGEECYYETIAENGMTEVFRIVNIKNGKNEKDVKYPHIISGDDEVKE